MKNERICFGQLIYEIRTGKPKEVELLTRLKDPTIPLDRYLSTLSKSESLSLVAEQLEVAAAIHQETGLVSTLNVPATLIGTPEDNDRLKALIRAFGRPLVVEFTETYPMPDSRACNRLFCELRDLDCEIALDDFGTGFNGMSIFADYDFDIVKIDRCLIMDINERPNKISLLKMVIEMVHSFGKSTVVEGVEDPDQIQLVSDVQPRYVQGFFYHKPQYWLDLPIMTATHAAA
jgi:EAL domain-containing protein (putative c-di-GMP-specific phosphodiesterase class I)